MPPNSFSNSVNQPGHPGSRDGAASLDNLTKAFQSAAAAVKQDPTWWEGYFHMGKALEGLNELEDAYTILSHGILQCQAAIQRSATSSRSRANANGVKKLNEARVPVLVALPQSNSNKATRRAARFSRDAHRSASDVRVFCVSDLHVDSNGNIEWCKNLSTVKFRNDVLLVAGDVGDSAQAVKIALTELKARFRRVFYMPGNHDLWIRPGMESQQFQDSICKMFRLMDICDEIDVDMGPAEVAKDVFIVPLFSWYSCTFDEANPFPGASRFDRFCKWPFNTDEEVWKYMLTLNKTRAKNLKANRRGAVCISMSHFLPRTELPYSKYVPELVKNVGCKELDLQIEMLQSDVHVFGHTHINTDRALPSQHAPPGAQSASSRRYVQYALENCGRSAPPYCLWEGSKLVGRATQ
eukprot:jgi/Tetstr1/441540/TSEL_029770.t1